MRMKQQQFKLQNNHNSLVFVCFLFFFQRNLMEYYSAVDVSNMVLIFAR